MASSRRRFLKNVGSTVSLLSASSFTSLAMQEQLERREINSQIKVSSNDTIRVGVIGMGIIGFRNVQTMLSIPGVELVACCDLYQGRLARAKELFGAALFTTTNFQEVLDRKDIDVVIVCTSDNWHSAISIAAMRKGKAVYCEKPMVHQLTEGHPMIRVQQETKAILQVGSQRVSSIAYAKAKEFIKAGEIGQLNCVEATFDRQSVLGAWQYTMPTDANETNVDWKRYVKNAKTPYDAKKFFWWRNYKEYGTGMAGDLFVHLLSGLHFITDSNGPTAISSMGDLVYWKDGRNVPDVMTAILHYPATATHPSFQLMLRANFISGENDKMTTKYIGSEGVLEFGWNDFTIRHSKMPVASGIGGWDALDTYPKQMQQELLDAYNRKFTEADKKVQNAKAIQYAAPSGYSDSRDHFINFFESIRTGKPVVEDVNFGFRAAAASLACNESYYQQKIIRWDPEKMKVLS